MERCFIASKESDYLKEHKRYEKLQSQQRKFVDEFMSEKGIESNKFLVGGDGFINKPFKEHQKSDIRFRIVPTEKDIETFGSVLNKPNEHGLCMFRKNSSIAKEFAEKCVDNEIVVNLHSPRVGDYFGSLRYGGYSYTTFELDNDFYLAVESDKLKEDELPKGFKEIKQSEFYLAKERLLEKKGTK
ncbi:MAG: hypothetical protein FH761_16530 [Firmicutes bacterium]|nr:hypothetical protein [Bacillota bacterium]